jgi:hypothetical protein
MKRVVTSETKTFFQDILGDTSTDYLASVATYVSFCQRDDLDGMGD